MIEIIPNWHPIFVHFTVGLFSGAVVFYLLSYLASYLIIVPTKIATDLETTGRWCLWAAGFTVIMTIIAGFYAYNTVRHDGISHLAMVDHRNWALPTVTAIVLIALWSMWRDYKHKKLTLIFIIALLIIQGILLATAWRGAELVFRYGLGVMSLPKAEGEGHHHHHDMDMPMNSANMPVIENHEQHYQAN